MKTYDLLIKDGFVVDPANNRLGQYDLAMTLGKVVEVDLEILPDKAKEVFNARKKYVFPGLVDTHVHLTPPDRAVGFGMLARAGVTCALDCAGPVEEVVEGMARKGSGISVAVLNRLDPGATISGPDAKEEEIKAYLDKSLSDGAFGLKILGGHLPLTPETTAASIEVCNRAGAYVAFHCGSTQNGSNVKGLLDAISFTENNRLHLCHINAYCRGLTHRSPVEETVIALDALSARPDLISESHLAPFNSCWSKLENGVPRSHVTRTCLKTFGFEASKKGILEAAKKGYLRVHKITGNEVVFAAPEEGAAYLKEVNFDTMVSFPVNHRSSAFLTATEKDNQGRFIVTALSSDGGGIPRNFLLSHGLSLVRFDAMTLSEFVHKCALAPARMLGMNNKGHLGVGADADVVVVDPDTHQAELTVAKGKIIMANGTATGSGGVIITTERGQKHLTNRGVPNEAADLKNSLFYKI